MTEFNTIQYCIDNSIPCFTFELNSSKKTNINWRQITSDNFKKYINSDNGFAVVTGYTHFVIDFDEKKHNPPQEIKNTLNRILFYTLFYLHIFHKLCHLLCFADYLRLKQTPVPLGPLVKEKVPYQ